jgi:CRAL/TRIO domain/CRAL/TRIO, N-terminal domain
MFARFKTAIQTANGKDTEEPHDEDDSLAKLRSVIHADPGLNGDQSAWADDACMLRFIRAAKFNHEAAVGRLRATLGWRVDANVDAIFPAQSSAVDFAVLRGEATCGKMFVLPAPDKAGRSVIVMRPGLQQSEHPENNIRFLIYTLERASQVCAAAAQPGGENKYIVIVDYRAGDFTLRRAPSMSVSKATLQIMQNHYPERLSHAFLFDAPSFFLPLFRMLRPFIDPVTFGKIHFVQQADAHTNPVCTSVLDPSTTPEEYGGHFKYQFNVDEYFKEI